MKQQLLELNNAAKEAAGSKETTIDSHAENYTTTLRKEVISVLRG